MKLLGCTTSEMLNFLSVEDNYGYNKIYEHQVKLKTDGVPGHLVQWLIENTEGKWGWHFKEKSATITFELEHDSFLFSLVYGSL